MLHARLINRSFVSQIVSESSTFAVIPRLFPALVYRCLSLCCFYALMFKSVRTAFQSFQPPRGLQTQLVAHVCQRRYYHPLSVCECVSACLCVWQGRRVGGTRACDLETNAEHYTRHLRTYTQAQKLANSYSQPEAIDPVSASALLTHVQIWTLGLFYATFKSDWCYINQIAQAAGFCF